MKFKEGKPTVLLHRGEMIVMMVMVMMTGTNIEH